jgi:hypothetical protein
VFSGQIPTLDSTTVARLPDEQTVLMSFEVPIELSGTFPVVIEFTGDDVYVAKVLANYSKQLNPIYTPAEMAIISNPATTLSEKLAIWTPLADPAFTSEDIATLETGTREEKDAVLAQCGLSPVISSGPEAFIPVSSPTQYKINVNINDVAVAPPDPLPLGVTGEWGWEIPSIDNVGTCSFDLVINQGLE